MNFSNSRLDLWAEPSLRKYLGEVRRKCGVVETLALPSMRDLPAIQIETLFVPPLLSVTAVDADSPPESWPGGENLLAALQGNSQIVVLGDPGGGKTTLSNWLAWRLTSGANAPLPAMLQNMLPIPCILRDMPVGCFSDGVDVLGLALAVASKLLGDAAADSLRPLFSEWVKSGQYVLILDGIDEIPISSRAVVANWMREAYKCSACALATSRIVGYEDFPVDSFVVDSASEETSGDAGIKRELMPRSIKKRLKGYTLKSEIDSSEVFEVSVSPSWAQLRYLMPFDKSRIADFARNWYRQRCGTDVEAKQKTSDLLTALAQSEVTSKLARTPNLLSLMAIVHRERAHLPDGKALLYDEIVNAYLNTIDKQRKIGPNDLFANYGWKERKGWLAYVGFKMQDARGWSSSVTGILASEREVLDWLMEAMAAGGVLDCDIIAREFLDWVARRSGLLLPRGEDRYAFVHLSFQEYFCACYLEGCVVRPAFVMDKLPKAAPVTKSRLSYWAKVPMWTETLIFLFELLSAEHDVEWVENLLEIVHDSVDGSTSRLSARLIKNKHVKLSARLHDVLADGCVPWMFSDWDSKMPTESDIFITLVNSGHCALLTKFNEAELVAHSAKGIAIRAWEKDLSRVRFLVVNDGCIPSESELQAMVNLRGVVIEEGGVLDFSYLRGLSKIRVMRLKRVAVLNVDGLGNLSALEQLQIHKVELEDVSPLSRLKKLTTLELCHLPVMNITPIGDCKKLNVLILRGLEVTGLEGLKPLKKLQTLMLEDLPISDISWVSAMRGLEYLQLCDMPVSDLSPLKRCTSLQSIDLDGIDSDDLSPLSSLVDIDGMFLSRMSVRSIEVVSKFKKLNYLYLKDLPLRDLESLRACAMLTSLSISGLEVDDISFVSTLSNLKALSLIDVPVADISPLRSLDQLSYLDMYHVNVVDVSLLADLPSLTTLHTIEDNGFDLKFLQGIDRLSVAFHSDDRV